MAAEEKRVLVTGGAGFIGSHLVDALLAEGYAVVVLDNLSTGHLANLAHVRDRIAFIKGDIRDAGTVATSVAGCEFVFHQAAVVSVPQTVAEPIESAMVNDIGTLQVLEAARRAGVRRVVLASSCAVYGDDPRLPKAEDMTPVPQSPYALQKFAGEQYARLYGALYGMETVCLRYFNVFGPRQDPSSPYSGVISIFMTRASAGQAPVIYGDGNQSRDFIFVKDVAAANLLAARAPGAVGRVFNVGTGRFVRIHRLWEMVAQMAGVSVTPGYEPARPGDIAESVADISRAGATLGFQPVWAFDRGIEKTYTWYQNAIRSGS